MSNIYEKDQEQQPNEQPNVPTPRGGGDISGKGISPPTQDTDSGSTDAGGGHAGDEETATTSDT